MRPGVGVLLLLAPAFAWVGLAPVIVDGLVALGSAVLQMTILMIVIYGNLWAVFHIRKSISSGGKR